MAVTSARNHPLKRVFLADNGTKIGLLVVLGGLWAVRLSAIKAAGPPEIPVHVIVSVAALGIATFFSGLALSRRNWPPLDRRLCTFYGLSGKIGFPLPFSLALGGADDPYVDCDLPTARVKGRAA